VAVVALEPLSLAKVAILAHVVKPFPMPYPIRGGLFIFRRRYRRVKLFEAGVRLVAEYTNTAVARKLFAEPVVVKANQLAQSFRDYVMRAIQELEQDSRNALIVYGQMPLNRGYSYSARMSNRAVGRGVFIPTAVVIDKCELKSYEADFCHAENLDGNERVAYLVDSGLLLTVFYVFVESRSAPLQIHLLARGGKV
jgi:hypothetical protein